MNKQALNVIIMAAGKGTRMKSTKPKVLQPLAGEPLLQHVLTTAKKLGSQKNIVIYGFGGEQVKNAFADEQIDWVEQAEQLGTGHAVMMTLPVLPTDGKSLILSGDVPLIGVDTLQKLADSDSPFTMLTMSVDNPFGLGRIIRQDGQVIAIVEEKDATDAQKQITEINSGVYCVANEILHRYLKNLNNHNAQGEYYLTDIVKMAVDDGIKIDTVSPTHAFEIEGVNDRIQLASLERTWQAHQAQNLMKAGVHIIDPSRFDLRGTLTVGKDVEIDINVVFEGDCEIGDNVKIGAGCIIKNTKIASGTVVAPYSIFENAIVGENNQIGPFARLRPNAVTADEVHIGNFVELKNTQMASGAKANHLAYLGDATIGKKTNIGAGTITANYDGVNKYKTVIGDEVRIGSNAVLIAPVTIGDRATVGGGSAITKDCEAGKLAIARGRQVTIEGWVRPEKPSK
ncbi:bifunctional UDP-N-acetylglucosamine diphosphorylase/glucosamine-1-phosphate N-acetyltransferase GlmU [Moraxella sp. ZY210820]|uniref:bifunctional UDP-N-acetylglucosamine diphosphorylase/glucosamine-1-phosphate N-acetyltransferase GlmU n=1 Tax=unclassified Moraxella TaxID=2685852 RepID=UPI0027308C00|nr:bifunctional UDP-N-acetylglucosamine diphosphorylase/glucosamine-1-phosphate N-acetyltransferase GlmU [Moraxella sp. ZY210820]WLF84106.1 bifunctional UDP-N-acetylglucosamine diphosphorylase/glucosamine-1-phosphate N-acetyltransferase GlmU [Moraxella sp. ZY210820]